MSKRVYTKDELDTLERWQPNANVMEVDGNKSSGPLTAEQIEKIQAQAYKEAYDEGLRKGFEQGFNNGSGKVEEAVGLFKNIVDTLANPVAKLDQDFQQQLSLLIQQISRQLIEKELSVEPELIGGIIKAGIKALPVSNQHIKIYLNPVDAEVARHVLLPNEKSEHWEIIEEAQLQRGDCRLATPESLVDATINNKLQSIISSLLAPEDGQQEA